MTDTDKELLELAAKAAGRGDHWWVGDTHLKWNPLEDDGDALRLAVKLKIPMQFPDWENMTRTWGSKNCLDAFNEPHGTDPLAATRRAITRAAAEIGRSM
jgi:hypothetical protein